MTWDAYQRLTFYERWMMRDELADLIPKGDEGEEGAPPTRPKRLRK